MFLFVRQSRIMFGDLFAVIEKLKCPRKFQSLQKFTVLDFGAFRKIFSALKFVAQCLSNGICQLVTFFLQRVKILFKFVRAHYLIFFRRQLLTKRFPLGKFLRKSGSIFRPLGKFMFRRRKSSAVEFPRNAKAPCQKVGINRKNILKVQFGNFYLRFC